jgi:cysteine desulfurase/selenocysteine lyase
MSQVESITEPSARHFMNPGKPERPAPDWSVLRRDFPILDQKVHGNVLAYLDNAATTQKPRQVIDALVQFYEHDNANVHRGIHELSSRATEGFERARARVATFLGASSPEEIIFTRGTTEGINLVANAWGNAHLKAGDEILLTEMEHHSNLVPWQLLAQRTGARIVFLPVTGDEGLLDLARLDALLTPKVKLLAFVHVSNSLGTVNPAAELCRRAREVGALSLVDAAQSAGHMPLNVQEMGCDFLAFSGHKTCGPTGIGVLYGRQEVLEDLAPWQGGGEMILEVTYKGSSFKPAPHRFEAGTPDISGAIGLAVALEYLDGIGREALFQHNQALGDYAAEGLGGLPGVRVLGPRSGRAGIVSFALDDVHAHDVVTFADQRGVALRGGHHCTQPLMRRLGLDSTARASFHLYNTRDEVDRLIEVVREIQRFFGATATVDEGRGASS